MINKGLVAKIYKIDSFYFERCQAKIFIDNFINDYNSEISDSRYNYFLIETPANGKKFNQLLYIQQGKEKDPSWKDLLLSISNNNKDVNSLKSRYPSFLLFIYDEKNEVYVICGGAGSKIIEKYLDSQFGFNVVERLIDPSNDELRGISQRWFLGVELASNRFFKNDYVFNDEDTFGKYYKGLDVFIESSKLQEIGIISKKNKLLVKGEYGFKIDKKVSYTELIDRIEKISELLSKSDPKIINLNPFRKISKWELKRKYAHSDSLEEYLIKDLANQKFNEFKNINEFELYHPALMAYLACSKIKVKYKKEKEIFIETYQKITVRTIFGKLGFDLSSIEFPKFLELVKEIEVWIWDEEIQKPLYECKLIDCFFGEVRISNLVYLKFEGEWFNYSTDFITDLNRRISQIFDGINIYQLRNWPADENTEGDYNKFLADNEGFILGDRKFYKKLELADLIKIQNDEFQIVHVKKGLDRDLRVLQSQILNSAKVMLEFKNGGKEIEIGKYFDELVKAKENDSKLIDFDSFKAAIYSNKIHYVFAFCTKSKNSNINEIVNEIQNSNSEIAKISILHTYYTIKQLGLKFSIAKVIIDD